MTEAKSTQPQLPPRPETYIDRTVERIKPGEDTIAIRYMAALEAENESLKASLDEARAGCVAWECAVSSLKAHLQDRIAMKDESQPDIYLSILQSDVANVARDTKQIRDATWHRERLYVARTEKAEAELAAMTEDRNLWQQAHDEDCPNRAILETLEAERDKALEVIREYREDTLHNNCGASWIATVEDNRCSTCIKADALLKKKGGG